MIARSSAAKPSTSERDSPPTSTMLIARAPASASGPEPVPVLTLVLVSAPAGADTAGRARSQTRRRRTRMLTSRPPMIATAATSTQPLNGSDLVWNVANSRTPSASRVIPPGRPLIVRCSGLFNASTCATRPAPIGPSMWSWRMSRVSSE